jgi:hypothetical protein
MFAHLPPSRFLCSLQYSHLVKVSYLGVEIHNHDANLFEQLQGEGRKLDNAMILFKQRKYREAIKE